MSIEDGYGRSPSGSGCSPTASAVPASCKQSIPNAWTITRKQWIEMQRLPTQALEAQQAESEAKDKQ